MISEAAKQVQVESHVLRYWEEELQLPIKRNDMGHRYYTMEDVRQFKEIKMLKEQGLQLKAIKTILQKENAGTNAADKPEGENALFAEEMTAEGKSNGLYHWQKTEVYCFPVGRCRQGRKGDPTTVSASAYDGRNSKKCQ